MNNDRLSSFVMLIKALKSKTVSGPRLIWPTLWFNVKSSLFAFFLPHSAFAANFCATASHVLAALLTVSYFFVHCREITIVIVPDILYEVRQYVAYFSSFVTGLRRSKPSTNSIQGRRHKMTSEGLRVWPQATCFSRRVCLSSFRKMLEVKINLRIYTKY